ncbi:MAG TPA: hypothetical protein EYQ25_09150 [Planctomycetes bacterium]|nr:hypothetical protein [Planctomycetota bacterium]
MRTTPFLLVPAALFMSAGALAQGDDCSVATAITGASTWAFDTTAATTSGFSGGSACTNAGSLGVGPDQFMQWTADAAGTWQIDLIGSVYDTKLNIHTGTGCTATCTYYNDDFSGLQSGVIIAGIVAGDTFLIQLGGFGGQAGLGTLNTSNAGSGGIGNDDCSTATAIGGVGNWTYDTILATTSGFAGGSGCTDAGSLDLGNDAFFQWTASAAGDYLIDTCGSGYDTKLNAHSGTGCAATCTAYNDDGPCGAFNSELNLTGVNAGDTFLIQCGGWGGASGAGVLNIGTFVDPCAGQVPDMFAPNHSCAAPAAIGDGTYSLNTAKTEPDFFSFTVADGGTVTIDALFISATADLDAMLYEAGFCNDDQNSGCGGTLACGFSASDNENLIWTNTTGADMDCILRVHVWPNTAGDCNDYDLVLTGAGPGGPSLFCSPANVHSGGGSATLATSSVSGPGLYHLEATDGPADQFGYFLVAAASMDPGVSVSQGQLCLTAPIGRYSPAAGGTLNSIGRFDAAGVMQSLSGNSSVGSGYDVPAILPSPPGGVIVIGATWHYQLWYRDGTASNFSDGISVTF